MENRLRSFIPLFLIIFIDSLGYFLVIPVLMRLLMESGYGLLPPDMSPFAHKLLFGIVVSLSPLASVISGPWVGNLSDHWGRRKTLLLCLVGSLLGFILPALGIVKQQLWLVLLGRTIAGAASSSQPIAQAAITDISSGKNKAYYLSMITFAMVLGMDVGPVLGGYLSDPQLVHWFNATTPFLAASILAAVSIVLLVRYMPETNAGCSNKLSPRFIDTWQTWSRAIKNADVRSLLFIVFIGQFSWSIYYLALPHFLPATEHFTTEHVSLFLTYIGIWMSLGLTVLYPLIIKRVSLERCLSFCLLGASVGYAACYFSPSFFQHALWAIPLSIFAGMYYPTLLAVMSNRVDETQQGWLMGVANGFLGLAWLINGILASILASISPSLPLEIPGVTMLFGFILFSVDRYARTSSVTQTN